MPDVPPLRQQRLHGSLAIQTQPRPPAIGVLTCPRRAGADYLIATLTRVDAEGGAALPSRAVYVDGDPAFVADVEARLAAASLTDWRVVSVGGRVYGLRAFRAALAHAAGAGRDLIMLEDDLELAPGAIATMAATPVPPGAGMLSFFDMKEFPPGAPAGIHTIHPRARGLGFWGCQALRFDADMLAWLAVQDWRAASLARGPDGYGQDLVLGDLIAAHPTRNLVAFRLPCLVEHVGAVSSYSPFGLEGRRATNPT